MSLSSSEKKQLRRIAHHLDPVVTIGDQGLTQGVTDETERALTDHELIKVRVNGIDRVERQTCGDELAQATQSEVVQRIGKIVVLYRGNPKADVRLSNLKRYG